MECEQGALIEETGLKWVKNADNDKLEVASGERAVKAQISNPLTFLINKIIFQLLWSANKVR